MIRLQVLGAEGVKQIHAATLRVLSEVGVILTHPGARELLVSHGARVEGDRVLLPADLVERCVAQCPHTVKMQGRDPTKAIVLGDGDCHAHNVGGVPNIADRTMERAGLLCVMTTPRQLACSTRCRTCPA